MGAKRTIPVMVMILAGITLLPGTARAQDNMSIRIDKHAQLGPGGGIAFTVHVACALPGTLDFREGFAGGGQQKSGAQGEGGLSPTVLCDGVERVYRAEVSPITEAGFVPGPAGANATAIACNNVGDQQVCVQASASRRVVITGR
jgi:hypothetical protein